MNSVTSLKLGLGYHQKKTLTKWQTCSWSVTSGPQSITWKLRQATKPPVKSRVFLANHHPKWVSTTRAKNGSCTLTNSRVSYNRWGLNSWQWSCSWVMLRSPTSAIKPNSKPTQPKSRSCSLKTPPSKPKSSTCPPSYQTRVWASGTVLFWSKNWTKKTPKLCRWWMKSIASKASSLPRRTVLRKPNGSCKKWTLTISINCHQSHKWAWRSYKVKMSKSQA